jgi:multiple sugar transport system ATP-binding protein
VKVGADSLTLDREAVERRPALERYVGRDVILGIRPEDLEDPALETGTAADRRLHGTVQLTEALGSEIMVHFGVAATPAVTEDVRELAHDTGDDRTVRQLGEGGSSPETTMVGRFGARSRVRTGDQVEVAVDTRALHFFDPETGLGIYDETAMKGVAE